MNAAGAAYSIELVRRLLPPAHCDHAAARAVIARARNHNVDVLSVIANAPDSDPEDVYRRLAELLGVDFCTRIEHPLHGLTTDADIDSLSEARSARGVRDGVEVLYICPRFEHVERLWHKLSCTGSLAGRLCIVSPRTLRTGLAEANANALLTNARDRLARRFPLAGAHQDLSIGARSAMVGLISFAIIGSFAPVPVVQPLVLALVFIIIVTPSLFRLWAAASSGRNTPIIAARQLTDAQLPVYSVLIPLRDEAHMVPQIAQAMRRLDYPKEKLNVIFVVESASPKTVAAVRRQLSDPWLSLVVVPKQPPLTKPKALNFALPLVQGEHVVVFDAEDVPDPEQLRRAASLFAQDQRLDCLQAELLIANGGTSFVASMFAAEYAGHFGVLLPAIGRASLPMPLGGTSNHFRTETLRRIGAWDAFNVTEDADLGIRMSRLGMKMTSFASSTWEEAPEKLGAWIKQRSRWIKGWMQTLLVHSARPRHLLRDLGWRKLCAFYIFVGGMVISTATHALFLLSTLIMLCIEMASAGAPSARTIFGLSTLPLGYCGAAVVSIIGLQRLGERDRMLPLLGLPIYWLMAWFALLLASYDLLVRPYHWSKTAHKGIFSKPATRKATNALSSSSLATADT